MVTAFPFNRGVDVDVPPHYILDEFTKGKLDLLSQAIRGAGNLVTADKLDVARLEVDCTREDVHALLTIFSDHLGLLIDPLAFTFGDKARVLDEGAGGLVVAGDVAHA